VQGHPWIRDNWHERGTELLLLRTKTERLMRLIPTALLALAATAALGLTTYADNGNPPDTIVQVSGSFTELYTGPGTVGETFSESYQLDETTGTLVAGSMSFTGSGMFGPLSLFYFSPTTVDWNDAAGDQVQVTFYEDFNPMPLPGDTGAFWLYGAVNPIFEDWPGGTMSVSAVPEPAPLALLGIGLIGLIFIKSKFA
jgi:hypothetical protein